MSLRPQFLHELVRIVGTDGVVATPEGRLTYECDMHTFYKGAPDAVVLPTSTDQVAEVVRLCLSENVPVVPRGSGTGLIGGAMASRGGVMVAGDKKAAAAQGVEYLAADPRGRWAAVAHDRLTKIWGPRSAPQ